MGREDADDPVTVLRGAAERRQGRRLVQLGERQQRPLAHLARLVRGLQQDADRLAAFVAEPLGEVGEGLRGMRALVRLLATVGQDPDDPAHVTRAFETLDARLEERGGAHVTVLSDGRRAARRM